MKSILMLGWMREAGRRERENFTNVPEGISGMKMKWLKNMRRRVKMDGRVKVEIKHRMKVEIKHILLIEKLRPVVLNMAWDSDNKIIKMEDHETICGVQQILESDYKTQTREECNG
jgi:hypothetical protein